MPRRRRDEAVTERASHMLDQQAQRRREAAQRGAQTRRQRRAQQQSDVHPQPAAERPTQAPTARRSQPREHGGMLTVAIRGPLAEKMRQMAERHGVSLARLLQDAILVYEAGLAAGYQPGTSLKRWEVEVPEGQVDG